MEQTVAQQHFDQLRQTIYHDVLGSRKDTLFELLEAALVSPSRSTAVRLSMVPPFRRRWSSVSDALTSGSVDEARSRRLAQQWLARAPTTDRPVWAVDGTTWPRPAARTSPERTWAHRVAPGQPQAGVVPGWEYQWLVAVPEPTGSWVLPLDVQRRRPTGGTPTALALQQVRAVLAVRPADAPRPVVTADSSYDPIGLARAHLAADWLVRLTAKRRFFRAPPPYPGRGRPRVHGPVFRTHDPTTHGQPDRTASRADARFGAVQVAVWQDLHAPGATDVPLTVVRIHVERLPQSGRRPPPLWLAWVGGPLPADLVDLWRWYTRRFTVEHGFRFLKHELGWTTVRPREPATADRWTWLLALALWTLWGARAVVADQRLPWERPLPPERLTPGRVRRALPSLLAAMATPARAPRPRGKSPGRAVGAGPGPAPRYAVHRRTTKRRKRLKQRAT